MPTEQTQQNLRKSAANLDPLTGEPGAHPVGTGVGAAAGGATGAAIGSFAGPIGTAVGAVVGAVAGGLAGKGVAEVIDPTAEDAYWRERHPAQSYGSRPYEEYAPAYRVGYTGYVQGKTFDEREADLQMEYEGGPQKAELEAERTDDDPLTKPGTMQHNLSSFPLHGDKEGVGHDPETQNNPATYDLRWEEAREAARAAYERVHRGEAKHVKREIVQD